MCNAELYPNEAARARSSARISVMMSTAAADAIRRGGAGFSARNTGGAARPERASPE